MKKSAFLGIASLLFVSALWAPVTDGASADVDVRKLEQDMFLAVVKRDADEFLAKAAEYEKLTGNPASEYKTSQGNNLLHILIETAQAPNDPATFAMINILLGANVLPSDRDGPGKTPIDRAHLKFRDASSDYIKRMLALTTISERERLFNTSSPTIQKLLKEMESGRNSARSLGSASPLRSGENTPISMRSGRSSASPAGFFMSIQLPEEILTMNPETDLDAIFTLIKNGRIDKVITLLANTKKWNSSYVFKLLSTPTQSEFLTRTVFDLLIYHNQIKILNWIIRESGFTDDQIDILLLTPTKTADGLLLPLLIIPLMNNKFEIITWLLTNAGLSNSTKELVLQELVVDPSGIKPSILSQLLRSRKFEAAKWILNFPELTPYQKKILYSTRITVPDLRDITLLNYLLAWEQFEAAEWILNRAGLNKNEKHFLLSQCMIDKFGVSESLLFDLLLNKRFKAITWLFKEAGLTKEEIDYLLLAQPTDDGGSTLYTNLGQRGSDGEEAIGFLIGKESPLTPAQKKLIFGPLMEEASENTGQAEESVEGGEGENIQEVQ